MLHQITISGTTGTPPYDVYVCDPTFTYCYFVTGGTITTLTFDVPSPLDQTNDLIVKIVDSIGCELFQYHNC